MTEVTRARIPMGPSFYCGSSQICSASGKPTTVISGAFSGSNDRLYNDPSVFCICPPPHQFLFINSEILWRYLCPSEASRKAEIEVAFNFSASCKPPLNSSSLKSMPGFKTTPLPSTPTFSASAVPDFGAVVSGFDPANASPEEYKEIEELLYKHCILVFEGLEMTPETQYQLTNYFDKSATNYGHGNNKTGSQTKSILVSSRKG